jgi:hypothetical protein
MNHDSGDWLIAACEVLGALAALYICRAIWIHVWNLW